MSKLSVQNLTIDYRMKRTGQPLRAVTDLSFQVAPGEFVALLGPSGCGKSSLLNTISGIQRPAAGTIHIDQEQVTGPGFLCGMVFQSPALLPWRTVRGNVAYGLELRGLPRAAAARRCQPYIELVGLSGFEDSYPGELSGGMQQRANLARALAVQPKVLLCDEPLSALDAQTREQMQGELQRIWMETRPTTVYVTHQISEALFLADRILVMSARPGRVRAVFEVPQPRPRSLRRRANPELLEMEDRIWEMLLPEQAASA